MSEQNAPRVTTEQIEANIAEEYYFTAGEAVGIEDEPDNRLNLLTFCVLVMKNGFIVTGESACMVPETFDAAEGRKWARASAVDKIWPLLGFELQTHLAAIKQGH